MIKEFIVMGVVLTHNLIMGGMMGKLVRHEASAAVSGVEAVIGQRDEELIGERPLAAKGPRWQEEEVRRLRQKKQRLLCFYYTTEEDIEDPKGHERLRTTTTTTMAPEGDISCDHRGSSSIAGEEHQRLKAVVEQ
ncbi:hypothetical protein B296_00010473 [Ensete ventricosum]|uniref:Uncharacterized protein n=1 Tax=Ensete ventricosum TaxID=4639 RepID=A0A426Y7I9_ENSVE|nr:hypothetical protein B296_00010473 [Ensete ventricosum]